MVLANNMATGPMQRRRRHLTGHLSGGLGATLRCSLAVFLAAITFVSILAPAAARASKWHDAGGYSILLQSANDCENPDIAGTHRPAGRCNGEACCILNMSRDRDDQVSKIAILPVIISIISIKTVAVIAPETEQPLISKVIPFYMPRYPQPPPVV